MTSSTIAGVKAWAAGLVATTFVGVASAQIGPGTAVAIAVAAAAAPSATLASSALSASSADSSLSAPAAKAAKPAATSRSRSADKPAAWDLRKTIACSFMYNDNILGAGSDDVALFESGDEPWKFRHRSTDDIVLAPSLDLEARRDLVALGQTRFRFRVKRWTYLYNPIKTNTDFDFYARQYAGKDQSLELYLHAAPEQYIRQLTDRSPLVDPATPLQWLDFSFKRRIWNLTWRQTISRRLSGSLTYERNYRFYNREFMENDIRAWELRGSLSWAASKVFTFSGDYSYEDGAGRGYDEVGETRLSSDDSDPSYLRDLYRFETEIAWPKLARLFDSVSLTFLFMDYYYTTQKPLVLDPYHRGRRDLNYKGTIELQRRLNKALTARFAVRRSSRTVESPWEGDLAIDKAFVQWLTWVDLTYRF